MAIKKIPLKTINQYTLYGDLENFGDYSDLRTDLQTMGSNDEAVIRLISPGGRVDVGMTIINAIQECAGLVHIIVEYPCCSMGALIALSGSSLEMYPDTFLMFHDYSTRTYGKGNELELEINANQKSLRNMMSNAVRPFLTEKEIKSIMNGKDLYIHSDNPSLGRRMIRHFGDK